MLELEITDLKILNPEMPVAFEAQSKNVRLDIRAEIAGKSFINIDPRHIRSFVLKDEQTGNDLFKTAEMMKLIFIELPKFKEPEKLPKNSRDRWITFLKTGSDGMLEELKMGGENFFKAVSEVELAAMNPEERNIYYSRLDGLRDYLSDVSVSRIEGKAEGLAEGYMQAIRS